MAVNWDLYNKRLNINGSSKRERDLNSLKNNIATNIQNSLSCKLVKINGVDGYLNFTKNDTGYDITSLPNLSFKVGDYVEYKSLTYLIIKRDGDDEVYASGKMQPCNYTLKFQAPDGTILSYPCITSAKSFNEDETKIITLPSNQKSILCVFNDDTAKIKTGDRFYVDRLNNTTWHVLGAVDNTTYNYGDKGLIYFIVEQDVEQVSSEYPDRPDLGVCNYREPSVEPEPPEGHSYAVITCSNPNNEITLGSSVYRTLTPVFHNADGTVASGVTAVWSWELPSGFESAFNIVYDGNLVKIKVADNYDLLGMTVKANVQNSGGFYRGNITLNIAI